MKVEVCVAVGIKITKEIPENFVEKYNGYDCLTDEGFESLVRPIENEYAEKYEWAEVSSVSPIGEDPIYEN